MGHFGPLGSGSGSVFPIRIRIQPTKMNADPDLQHWFRRIRILPLTSKKIEINNDSYRYPTVLWVLNDIYLWRLMLMYRTYSKTYEKETWGKNSFFCWHLESYCQTEQDLDPYQSVIQSTNLRIWIRIFTVSKCFGSGSLVEDLQKKLLVV